MKRMITQTTIASCLAVASMCIATGCVKDHFDSGSPEDNLPPKDSYFNFELTKSVPLEVNYDVPGLTTIIEVYDQNPMMDDAKTKIEGIKPIYVAYTNDGKYEGLMNIPTAVKEAYVYTAHISAPKCAKLEQTTTGFVFDAVKLQGGTRNSYYNPAWATGITDVNVFPYVVTGFNGSTRTDNMYSIMAWAPSGWATADRNYYTKLAKIGAADESVGVVSTRLQEFMAAARAAGTLKELLRDAKDLNVRVPASAIEGMEINVSYLGEAASFYNTFGYYYYEDKGDNYTLSPKEFYDLKKYIMMPNVDEAALTTGETVKLLYFDAEGNKSTKFPANYVVGWFLIGNGYGSNHPATGVGGYANGGRIKVLPEAAYTSASAYTQGRFTSMSDDKGADRRFVSLYDTKSKLRVIGVEDNPLFEPDDYMDLLFVVKTTPELGGGDLPPIGPEDPEPEPGVWSVSGTLAYEDIWPYGGDYDLNDVMIEYMRDITFGKDNVVTKIKETFKTVQKKGSAAQDNFFACQYTTLGKVTPMSGVLLEAATNSLVIEESAKTNVGTSYVIERDMTGLGLSQDAAKTDFNPYIITKQYTLENRVEVHLPLHEMTSAADKTLMNEKNAYYIGSEGIYPFAIHIPIAGFVPADETKRIDAEGQYPSYTKWAISKGEQATDWYLQDKGGKK